MTNNEYEKFYGQKVGVITTGRSMNKGEYNISLSLEGTLDKETDKLIFLKDIKAHKMDDHHELEGATYHHLDSICSNYGTISKDKIISLYLIGKRVKNAGRAKIEKGPELIEQSEQPKQA